MNRIASPDTPERGDEALPLFRRYLWSIWIPLLIGLVALFPRLVVAFSMDWLADEIIYVDFIGGWFRQHLGSYIFQWHHTLYPPDSPYLLNPPLAIWLMTGGISLSTKLGASALIGARLINVLAGSGSCLLLYWTGKRFYSPRVGLMAALFLALAPPIVAVDGSAYLDTLTGFWILLDVFLLFLYRQQHKNWQLFTLAIALGLTLLTKLVAVPFVVIVWLVVFLEERKRRPFDIYNYLLFLQISVVTPLLLWAGARDLSHIQGVYRLVKGNVLSSTIGDRGDGPLYYLLMVMGKMPEIVAVLIAVVVATLALLLLQRWLRTPLSFLPRATSPKTNGLLLAIALITALFVSYSGAKTTFHRIYIIIPLVLLVTADGLNGYIDKYLPRPRYQYALLAGVLILSAYPLFTTPTGYYNSYSNHLVGGINGSQRFYRTGDGEGTSLAIRWLRENAPKFSQVSVLGFNWVAKKYPDGDLVIVPHFVDEGVERARQRGSEYFVFHRFFFGDPPFTQAGRELQELTPLKTIEIEGTPYVSVYRIVSSESLASRYLARESSLLWETWRWRGESATPFTALRLGWSNNSLRLDYTIKKGGNLYLFTALDKPLSAKGLSLEIMGDGNMESLYIDLLDQETGSYLRFQKYVGWKGPKTLEVEFDKMRVQGAPIPVLEVDVLKFSIDTGFMNRDISGSLVFSNLKFYEEREQ